MRQLGPFLPSILSTSTLEVTISVILVVRFSPAFLRSDGLVLNLYRFLNFGRKVRFKLQLLITALILVQAIEVGRLTSSNGRGFDRIKLVNLRIVKCSLLVMKLLSVSVPLLYQFMIRLIKINLSLIFKKDHLGIIFPVSVTICLRADSTWLSRFVQSEHVDAVTTEYFVISAVFKCVTVAISIWRCLGLNCSFSRDHLAIVHLKMRYITCGHLVIFFRGLMSRMGDTLALLDFLSLLTYQRLGIFI